MPFAPRLRLPRRRRTNLRLSIGEHEWALFVPQAEEPLVVEGFGDAVSLAVDLADLPVRHEAVVLLDERRRITAILLDPPAEVGMFVGRCDLPGLETPFCQTMTVVVESTVPTGPPSDDDRLGYQALRRLHMAQGLLLLDVLLTDGDTVRSLAIGCDPDPVWFDEFVPLDEPAA